MAIKPDVIVCRLTNHSTITITISPICRHLSNNINMKLLAFLSTLATVSAFTPANVGRTTSSLFMRLVYVLLHYCMLMFSVLPLTNYISISYYISDEAKVAGTVKW